MAQIRMVDINKAYSKGPLVVKNFNLHIEDGELLVFVGPSGCSKSTTLRMIAGLEDITRGKCYIGDRLVNNVVPRDRNIAMVFQNYALYPHMTVFNNIAFGLQMAKMPKDKIKKRVNEAAEMLDITKHLKKKPKELSGGERQRVALGRAIVRKPAVFLFDEPLSNLDAKLREKMRVELKKMHLELKTTMVYVTHDQIEAMTMGDRICVLNKGEIQQVDTPHNLYSKPANRFVAQFIGSPQTNIIETKIINENDKIVMPVADSVFTLPDEIKQKVLKYRDKEVYLAIRPEHISIQINGSKSVNNSLPSKVNVIEDLGHEQLIYFSCGENECVLRTGADLSYTLNTEYSFEFHMDRCQIFDKDTDKNILLN
ncbi:MAG: sn-glycerol-3-phosphate ABC transporter ATP-binding protein UgpC [Chitinispirillia bacterium]|jgi:multiple sugar transport system ATP-binding protein